MKKSTSATPTTETYTIKLQVHPGCRCTLTQFKKLAVPCIMHRDGWQKFGYRFMIIHDDHDTPQTHTPASHHTGLKRITITLTPRIEINRLFPSFSQQQLSVCVIQSREIFIHEDRWMRNYPDLSEMSLPQYRSYVLNHELGHALGFDHEPCSGRGNFAPIMLQQTLGQHGCKPSPFPRRVPSVRLAGGKDGRRQQSRDRATRLKPGSRRGRRAPARAAAYDPR
jgi:hypothetical protein